MGMQSNSPNAGLSVTTQTKTSLHATSYHQGNTCACHSPGRSKKEKCKELLCRAPAPRHVFWARAASRHLSLQVLGEGQHSFAFIFKTSHSSETRITLWYQMPLSDFKVRTEVISCQSFLRRKKPRFGFPPLGPVWRNPRARASSAKVSTIWVPPASCSPRRCRNKVNFI